MTIKTPQTGVFNEESKHFYFLEYRLKQAKVLDVKKRLAQSLAEASQSLPKVLVVLSFGKQAWQILQPKWTPTTLESFTTIKGQQSHCAVSTQADLCFWIQGHDISGVFDQAMHIQEAMQSVAELSLEQRGFDYHHSMDLIDFEDGTANPKTDELKREAALIPEGQPGAGGSLVLS